MKHLKKYGKIIQSSKGIDFILYGRFWMIENKNNRPAFKG